MILRRLIQHVRKQEWTAICLDFVIVVVGVYIGIQAQAWSTERENRVIERSYLESLHNEVLRMIRDDQDRVAANRERLPALEAAMAVLDGSDTATVLTMEHCDAIAVSHIYVGRVFVPPTVEELLSTGRLQLIRNRTLRSELVSLAQAVDGYRQLITDIQIDRMILSRKYPEMITLDLLKDEVSGCDFAAMAQSTAFLNDVADNRSRYSAYVDSVLVGQQDRRIQLHNLLDEELGIQHSEENTE